MFPLRISLHAASAAPLKFLSATGGWVAGLRSPPCQLCLLGSPTPHGGHNVNSNTHPGLAACQPSRTDRE